MRTPLLTMLATLTLAIAPWRATSAQEITAEPSSPSTAPVANLADRPASLASIGPNVATNTPEDVALSVLREFNAHQIALADLALARAPDAEVTRHARMLREDYVTHQHALNALAGEAGYALRFPAAEFKTQLQAERQALAKQTGARFAPAYWRAVEDAQRELIARLDTLMLPIVDDRQVYDFLLLTRVQAGMQWVEARRQIDARDVALR